MRSERGRWATREGYTHDSTERKSTPGPYNASNSPLCFDEYPIDSNPISMSTRKEVLVEQSGSWGTEDGGIGNTSLARRATRT